MTNYFKRMIPLVFATVILASSCSDSKTSTSEKTEINTMDSTSKAVKESREKLEEQTKKVEESLEKLDKEFDTTNLK